MGFLFIENVLVYLLNYLAPLDFSLKSRPVLFMVLLICCSKMFILEFTVKI